MRSVAVATAVRREDRQRSIAALGLLAACSRACSTLRRADCIAAIGTRRLGFRSCPAGYTSVPAAHAVARGSNQLARPVRAARRTSPSHGYPERRRAYAPTYPCAADFEFNLTRVGHPVGRAIDTGVEGAVQSGRASVVRRRKVRDVSLPPAMSGEHRAAVVAFAGAASRTRDAKLSVRMPEERVAKRVARWVESKGLILHATRSEIARRSSPRRQRNVGGRHVSIIRAVESDDRVNVQSSGRLAVHDPRDPRVTVQHDAR